MARIDKLRRCGQLDGGTVTTARPGRTLPPVAPALLKRRYLVLLALSILVGIAYFALWREALLANICAGFLLAYVVVVFVDSALEEERVKERAKVRAIALSLLQRPVNRQLGLLAHWYKVASNKPFEQLPSSYEDLFAEDFYQTLRCIDLYAKAPALPTQNWLTYSHREFDRFRRDVQSVLDRYAVFLESDTIELLERLADSSLVSMVVMLSESDHTVRALQQAHGIQTDHLALFAEGDLSVVRAHVDSVLDLVDLLHSMNVQVVGLAALNLLDAKNPPPGSARLPNSP